MLACDLRFASREDTLLCQWEVAWRRSDGQALPPVGRGRVLEILLVVDDLDGNCLRAV